MIKVIQLIILMLSSTFVSAQKKASAKAIPWLSPLDVQEQMQTEEKPLIIDIYTDWCHYCKLMDKTTWTNPQLKEYVSTYFFPVKFNAESKEEISWLGTNYTFKPAYKVHMLAAEWLKGNMVYPSTVIIPKDGESIILPGMMTPTELEPVLKYFGDGYYRKVTWQSFKDSYKTTWKKA